MKRFLASLATFSLVEAIGRHPAIAAGVLTLLGVGGGVGAAMLTTPTIIPAVSTNFSQSNAFGTTSNTLKPNNGTLGPFLQPSLPSTANALASWAMVWEQITDPSLTFSSGQENLFTVSTVSANTVPGAPQFIYQRSISGDTTTQWWNNAGPNAVSNQATVTGANANYNTGYYPFTAPCTGTCVRPIAGVWNPGNAGTSIVQITDPGFGYSVAPTVNAATIPNAGAQQTGITATCASGGAGMLVTTSVPVSPGLTPGQGYVLSGFTTTPANALNTPAIAAATTTVAGVNYQIISVGSTNFQVIGAASNTVGVIFTANGAGTGTGTVSPSWIATSVTGSGPYTVVGTAAGSCPTISSTGNFGAGTGATFNLPPFSISNPFQFGFTGVVTRNNQHACYAIGEYGADNSLFPGAAFITAVDEKGVALQGAPAEPLWLNMGSTNFQGSSTGTNILTVSGMNSYTMTAPPTFSGGQISFSTTTSPGFVPGSEFTVSGVTTSGASLNITYVAVAPTSTAGTGVAITGIPLSGPAGSPQAIASPGTITGAGSIVGVILPGMKILGTSVATSIMPYGTSSATGTGGFGTYVMSAAPTSINSGTPANVFAWAGAYYSAVANGGVPSGATLTARNSASGVGSIGDLLPVIGALNSGFGARGGFGGNFGNFAMLYGQFPQNTNGTPVTTGPNSLASLCTKATDIPTFAAANGLTVHSRYELNDIGVDGDSGLGDFTGHVTGNTLTVDTGIPSSAWPTGAFISGPGLCSSTCPTITASASTSSYTLSATLTNPVTTEAMKAGAYGPATPFAGNTFKGYVDAPSGVPTLHVTSLDDGVSHSGLARFTGTLSTGFTGSIVPGTGSNGAAIGQGLLTVSTPANNSGSPAVVGIGTTIVSAPGGTALTSGTIVVGITTGVNGLSGNYIVNNSQTVALEAMRGTGLLPGYPTALDVSGVTGTIGAGMYVTDGNTSLTGSPLFITTGSSTTWNVGGNTYPYIASDGNMIGSFTTLVPGEYIANSAMLFPVKVTGGWTACGISGAINGGLGCYTLSNNTNGVVGSNVSPPTNWATFTGTTASDGGAIAPGPALTIRDQGPGATFPVTRGAATGTVWLSGAYNAATLGGTPSALQAQFSLTANGPPITGCSACAWTNLSSGVVSGGAWSGQSLNIPAGGPYFVSVRAANGTAYATMPNYIKIGSVDALFAQGQGAGVLANGPSGFTSFASGLFGQVKPRSVYTPNSTVITGPDVVPNYAVGTSTNLAGDRFGLGISSGVPFSEGSLIWGQLLSNSTGYPTTLLDVTRDGIGIFAAALGNTVQTQTVAVADGTTLAWCSTTAYCANAGSGGALDFNAAGLTGANFKGTIATSGTTTLTVGTWTSGALEPGMVLSPGLGVTGWTGNPTLVNCVTNCNGINGATSTWVLSSNPGTFASATAMFADPSSNASLSPFTNPGSTGSAPWKYFNAQLTGLNFSLGGFGSIVIKPGTFSIIDTTTLPGTVICTDATTFAYNLTGGTCAGANIDTANTFVNYLTGDYEVAFTSGHAPTNLRVLTAQWTAIVSPAFTGGQFGRPPLYDWFGDGTTTGGLVSSVYAKAPGGVSANIYAAWGGTDFPFWDNSIAAVNPGYQFGAYGYTQAVSWLFGTKFPNTIPGANGSSLFGVTGQWRAEGPERMFNLGALSNGLFDAWNTDVATKSTFSGTIASSVLTLSGAATGPMWEGEVIDCVTVTSGCPMSGQSGVYITALTGGTWGASGSTYALAGASTLPATTGAMQNEVYWAGPGPVAFLGTLNDLVDQPSNLSGTTGTQPHTQSAIYGFRRSSARWAAMLWGQDPSNSTPFSDPTIDRVKANAAGCDTAALAAPCFDTGGTYFAAKVATATWTTGGLFTITGGLAAHARPFVVGQVLNCTPTCGSGLVITSLSVPPTQSTATGAGEVGQTFTFQTAAVGGSLPSTPCTSSCTVDALCVGVSGTGSNCIDIAISINNSGTFGTAASLATCGVNNLNGVAPNYVVPNGKCQDNGIGELVRSFRIGTNQLTYGNNTTITTGSVFDDGIDPAGGAFHQNQAFTCNIVAAKVVQCVLGPTYAGGVVTAVGQWGSPTSGSPTYISYGDVQVVASRFASLLGYVGGQSFPFSSGGTGYANQTALAAICPVKGTGSPPGINPLFDITTSGGVIIGVQPSGTSTAPAPAMGLGIGVSSTAPIACTLTPATGTGFNGSNALNINVDPVEGTGGIATYNTDSNTMGMFLYDNSGFPGNPNNSFFTNGQGGYYDPGVPLRPFGVFQGVQVSG